MVNTIQVRVGSNTARGNRLETDWLSDSSYMVAELTTGDQGLKTWHFKYK